MSENEIPEEITLDFSDVKPDSYTVVPPGAYNVIVDEVRVKVGANSGMPYLNFKLKIDDEGSEFHKRNLYTIVSLGNKDADKHMSAMSRVMSLMQSLGVNDVTLSLKTAPAEDGNGSILISPDLVGATGKVRTKTRKYNDTLQPEVTRFEGTMPQGGSNGAASFVSDDDEDADEDEPVPAPTGRRTFK